MSVGESRRADGHGFDELERSFARGEFGIDELRRQLASRFEVAQKSAVSQRQREGAGMERIVVTLGKGKETKTTHRFEAPESENAPVTTLYIKKSAFPGGRVPSAVRITVESAD